MTGFPRLLADIGGTRARFGLQMAPNGAIEGVEQYLCADFAGIEEAIRHYLQARDLDFVQAVAMGVATPITGDLVSLTNSSWRFSQAQLKASLRLERLAVINDFAALALSLPRLGAGELACVSRGTEVAGAPKIVIGPGTGLGLAGLISDGADGWRLVSGEGGHCSLAPVSDEQSEVLTLLRRRFDHVSAERVLSGQGLVNLYRAASALEGHAPCNFEAQDIASAAEAGADRTAHRALRLFTEFLGGYAGSQALAFGARGGVYLAGGVFSRIKHLIDMARLRRHFVEKGRFSSYLSGIPIWSIEAPYPALQGALAALDDPVRVSKTNTELARRWSHVPRL